MQILFLSRTQRPHSNLLLLKAKYLLKWCAHLHMPRPMCGGQRAACDSCFSPSTWRNPGTEVRSSGLAKPLPAELLTDFKISSYDLLSMLVLNKMKPLLKALQILTYNALMQEENISICLMELWIGPNASVMPGKNIVLHLPTNLFSALLHNWVESLEGIQMSSVAFPYNRR